MRECEGADCGNVLCDGCYERNKCSFCGQRKCGSCLVPYECDLIGCNKVICRDCMDSNSNGDGGSCNACEQTF